MGKKKDYQLNGQLCFDFNTNTEHYVVQSNELLEGKQNLKLNSAKIVRALIMQIKPDDEELKSYFISVQELAKMLHISAANLYRDMDTITDDILTNHVAIKDPNGEKFIKIQQIEVFGRHGAAHGIILICVCDIPRIRRITTPPPQAE